jgi:DNA-binding beta-propeller fold protein YncE
MRRAFALLAGGVLATLAIAGSAVASTGTLIPQGCISDVGGDPPAGCGVTAQGLFGVRGVAVSPDGASVYVASAFGDHAIVRFDRDTATGALTPRGCLSDAGDPAGCGTTQEGMGGAQDVAVSADGASVYVASAGDDAIVRFDRDTATGALTPQGCISDVGDPAGCGATQQGLTGAHGVVVSPDGASVYVAAAFDDATVADDSAIVRFDRDTATGALTPQGCISDAGDPAGCGATQQGLGGASGVAVSPDGDSVYVASHRACTPTDYGDYCDGDNAIVRLDRDAATGALTQQGCIADGAGCGATQQGLEGATGVAVSPDDASVYVASSFAIVRFDRDTATGALTPRGCISDVGDPAGCGTTQQGLGGAQDVAVSPDGASVYVAGGLVSFDRDAATGALSGRGCFVATCGLWLPGLESGARGVAVSPDGASVYASTFSAIVRFDRGPAPTCKGRPATHIGSPGGDAIRGTTGPDVVVGRGGDDDIVSTGPGDDLICAGPGADVVWAEAGSDRVYGQGGADEIMAGGARDVLFGQGGSDHLFGGPGDDRGYGGAGGDLLVGDLRVGPLTGRAGRDLLFGGPGFDLLRGGKNHDRAFGGAGQDLLIGAMGHDWLFGGPGGDALRALRGRPDRCYGGPGRDLRPALGCEQLWSIP